MRTLVRHTLGVPALAAAVAVAMATPAAAQTPASLNGLGDVILELARSTPTPGQQRILDQLFSGRIDATIVDGDGNNANFGDTDLILFALSPVSRNGVPVTTTGSRADFNRFVEANADSILAILFPGSLTESTSGIDVAQGHAQALLLSTALAAGSRGAIGGRVEFESFDVEGASGKSIQGLFRVRDVAIEGRYAQLSNTLSTKSTNIGANYHPSWVRGDSENEVRVGGDGYVNVLFSRSRTLDLGSFDYGAGVWASGKRSFEKISVSFGGVLLGSKTYIPLGLIGDDFRFVAQSFNDRSMRWDLTYGGAVQYPLSDFWAIGAKLLQSASVKSPLDSGRTSQLMLVNLAYLVGGDRPIDFGYRFSRGGERYSAHGIFMNANFGF
jgi:hypothetical protein